MSEATLTGMIKPGCRIQIMAPNAQHLLFVAVPFTVALFVAAFVANIRADALLKELFQYYPEQWVQCGKPTGWLWKPPNGSSFHFGRKWPTVRETYFTPVWLSQFPKLERPFLRWQSASRVYSVMWACALILWIVFGFANRGF